MSIQDSTCTFCSENNSRPKYTTEDIFGNSYLLRNCLNCNAIFLTPKPSDELLVKAYDDSYYGEGDEKFKKGYIEQVLDYFRKKRAKLIKKYTPSGKVLDVGCGNGKFLSFVKELGDYEIHGTEMQGGSALRAQKIKGLNLSIGKLHEIDFKLQYFDAITLFHVFEHLDEPKKTLHIIHDILKKDGILIISFPNIDSFQSRWFRGKWLHLDPPRHLFFFSPKDFKKIMHELAFELLEENHFNIQYNPYGLTQSILNVICKKREVLYEHLKGNKEYVKEYSQVGLWTQQVFFKLSTPLFILFDFAESLLKKSATVEFVFRKK